MRIHLLHLLATHHLPAIHQRLAIVAPILLVMSSRHLGTNSTCPGGGKCDFGVGFGDVWFVVLVVGLLPFCWIVLVVSFGAPGGACVFPTSSGVVA